MTRIDTVEIRQVDLQPKVKRTDAIQAFVVQETVLVTVRCDDGSSGTRYTYTIGTGGSSVVALLRDHAEERAREAGADNGEVVAGSQFVSLQEAQITGSRICWARPRT